MTDKKTYHKWRDMPEISVEVLEDFLFWLEEEDSGKNSCSEEEINLIKHKIDQFLCRDKLEQIKFTEQELLMNWAKQVEGGI